MGVSEALDEDMRRNFRMRLMLAGSPMLPRHFRANLILSSRPLLIASSARSWMGYRQSTLQSSPPNA